MTCAEAARTLEARLRDSRAALLATVAALRPEDLDRARPGGGWTAREQLDHIERSERAFLVLLRLLRVRGALARLVRVRDREAGPPTLDFSYAGTSIASPWLVRPRGRRDLADLLARLERTRGRTLRALARLATRPGRGPTWPHPAFGRIDALQWIAVAALHERHHVEQMAAGITR